jgi:hypothetical protein
MRQQPANIDRMIQAGVLAWLLPGGGHFLLGHRGLGTVFCVTITTVFMIGLLFGGLKNSINPATNKWLFLAEMGAGGYTVAGYLVNLSYGEIKPADLATPDRRDAIEPAVYAKYVSFYPASDIAQIYLAAAGLLNLLAILDALSRAQTGGLPTYHRELDAQRGGG